MTNSATARSGIAFTAQPVVQILDAYGNLVSTGGQSTQTVTLTSTGSTISGTAAISASAGIATFSNIALEGLIGSKTISAEILTPSSFSTSGAVSLSFGDAAQLTLERAAAGAANRSAFTTQPQVALRDSAGNLVTGTAATIVYTASPNAALTLASAAVSTSNGIATFAFSSIRGTIGSYTISYSVSGASASSIASVSQTLTLTHGVAASYAFVQQPTTARAGISLSEAVVIKAT
jgi:hypothetical protein